MLQALKDEVHGRKKVKPIAGKL